MDMRTHKNCGFCGRKKAQLVFSIFGLSLIVWVFELSTTILALVM